MPPTSLWRDRAGQHSIPELAQQHGTPLYVYDASRIRDRVRELGAFDAIRYAQKANSNLSILRLIREAGCVVDAVSAGECGRAFAAGFAASGEPPGVVYTADVFDRESLELVVAQRIPVNCGSPDMIDQYGERAGTDAPGITLRINPGFGHGHDQKVNTGGETSKHGIWHEQIEDCVTRAERHGLRVTGVHAHIGSGVDMTHLARVAEAVCGYARRVGPSVDTISAGGGLSVPYREGEPRVDPARYFEIWDTARKKLVAEFGHPVRLELEPGRFLVAEAGLLLTEVRAIKTMGSKSYYLVDAGFNNLARPVLYGSYHPISIACAEPDGETREVVVAGPLCESGDIFTQSSGGFVETRELPNARVGDILTIECAGAYGFTMGSNYNSKPHAAEVLIDGADARLIRRRQPLEDLWADELGVDPA